MRVERSYVTQRYVRLMLQVLLLIDWIIDNAYVHLYLAPGCIIHESNLRDPRTVGEWCKGCNAFHALPEQTEKLPPPTGSSSWQRIPHYALCIFGVYLNSAMKTPRNRALPPWWDLVGGVARSRQPAMYQGTETPPSLGLPPRKDPMLSLIHI